MSVEDRSSQERETKNHVSKVTQHDTNRKAHHLAINFKNLNFLSWTTVLTSCILIIFVCFILSLFCVHAANNNFTLHTIMSSLNDTNLFPVYAHSVSNLWCESYFKWPLCLHGSLCVMLTKRHSLFPQCIC